MSSSAHVLVLRELVKRDFRGRYAGSWLGFLWSFVQPLWQFILFSFVFSAVLKVSPLGERTSSFAAFLFSGLLPWIAIQEGLMRSATAITDNAPLVKKLRFPPEILVLSIVLGALAHEAIAAGVFLVALATQGALAWSSLPWLLVALPLQFALTLGLALLLSATHVFVRDTAQALGLLFSAWFYLTPIVYPMAYLPARLRPWIERNPLTPLVALYRRGFLGGDVDLAAVALLTAFATLALACGWALFRRLRPSFADEV